MSRTKFFPVLLVSLFLTSSCLRKNQVTLNPVENIKNSSRYNYEAWPISEGLLEKTGIFLVKEIRPFGYGYRPEDLTELKGQVYGTYYFANQKSYIKQAVVILDHDNHTRLFLILDEFVNLKRTTYFWYWKNGQWTEIPAEIRQQGFGKVLSRYLYNQTGRLLYFDIY